MSFACLKGKRVHLTECNSIIHIHSSMQIYLHIFILNHNRLNRLLWFRVESWTDEKSTQPHELTKCIYSFSISTDLVMAISLLILADNSEILTRANLNILSAKSFVSLNRIKHCPNFTRRR